MARYSAKGLKITFNGADITEQFQYDGVTEITVDLTDRRTTLDILSDPERVILDLSLGAWLGALTLVRVRPAAPIRACLWRRNLDGGNWRKRGHVAHRK